MKANGIRRLGDRRFSERRLRHEGRAENVYETMEAPFEAAIVAAPLVLRQGHGV